VTFRAFFNAHGDMAHDPRRAFAGILLVDGARCATLTSTPATVAHRSGARFLRGSTELLPDDRALSSPRLAQRSDALREERACLDAGLALTLTARRYDPSVWRPLRVGMLALLPLVPRWPRARNIAGESFRREGAKAITATQADSLFLAAAHATPAAA